MDNALPTAGGQAGPRLAFKLQRRLDLFLLPLLVIFDAQLDARLVRTVVGTVSAFICWRHRAHGLLLRELRAYLLSPVQAPAGTKRLSNLLRSPRWQADMIAQFLWEQADARLAALESTGQEAYVAWDESVLEKPESRVAEGLCPVRSSKAGRLLARKPGYNRPPGCTG